MSFHPASTTAVLVAAGVLCALWPRRPATVRTIAAPTEPDGPARASLSERIGRAVSRRSSPGGPPLADVVLRRRGRVVLAALASLPVAPPLAVLVLVAGWLRERSGRVGERRRRTRAVAEQLPDAVDLLLLCTGAGLSLPLAHERLVGRLPGPVGDAFERSAEAARRGMSRADAVVTALDPLGERAAGVGHVLADHLRYGTPLAAGLERMSLELKLHRRRQAEIEARKVPVRLLAPLVTCVLPSFGLLTVVPLLAASIRELPI